MQKFSSYYRFPTSHTTVHAVRHTAVSCFLTSRCVASCFQPSHQTRHFHPIVGFRPIVVDEELHIDI